MSILINKNSRVIIQGITGSEGTFHGKQMLDYGTNIVAGVTPGKAGFKALDDKIDVYNTVKEAKAATNANTSIIFVPPRFAANAIMEAVDNDIGTAVCISEGIPVKDMIEVKNKLDHSKTTLIGPNCPGVISVDECKLGIIPGFICKKGSIGILSKSGTLTYEAIDQIIKEGFGVSTAVGIGGDQIIGSDMIDVLKLFNNDNDTDGIVIIGEIGGTMEVDTAKWIKENCNKPVVGFIAGQTAPPGRRMGHAGAIVSGGDETAEAKMKILEESGVEVCNTVADIGKNMKKILKRAN